MRDIQTDYANARTMADAKSWISVCLKSHQDCATKTSIPMPSRILRISKDGKSVVLIPSNGQTARYVALSYPWGGNIDFVQPSPPWRTGVNLSRQRDYRKPSRMLWLFPLKSVYEVYG